MDDFEDKGVAITLGVLALSGIVLVGGYAKTMSVEKSLLEKQLVVLADRVSAVKAARKQVDEAFEQREQQVRRAAATEAQYAGLLTDLLELAKVDPDARLVVQKWKIQSSGDSQAAPAEGASKQTVAPTDARSPKPAPASSVPQKSKAGP